MTDDEVRIARKALRKQIAISRENLKDARRNEAKAYYARRRIYEQHYSALRELETLTTQSQRIAAVMAGRHVCQTCGRIIKVGKTYATSVTGAISCDQYACWGNFPNNITWNTAQAT